MIGCAKLGMHFVAVAPKVLFPEEGLVEEMRAICEETGGSITLTDDIKGGRRARTPSTPMCGFHGRGGPDGRAHQAAGALSGQHRNDGSHRQPDVIFLHCLPSFHDLNTDVAKDVHELGFGLTEQEVTDEVFRSPASKVFDEAETACTPSRRSCAPPWPPTRSMQTETNRGLK